MIKQFISKVVKGEDLTEAEMEKAMTEIMIGTATPAQIGASPRRPCWPQAAKAVSPVPADVPRATSGRAP